MLVLLAVVLAASPAPYALPDADAYVHLPSLEKSRGVIAFLQRAGERAPTLRPQNWNDDLHPLVAIDLERPESLAAAGLDPTGWATTSFLRDVRLTCNQLGDPARFRTQADARLRQLGDPWTEKAHGLTLTGAQIAKTVRAGYVVREKIACAADGPGADKLLRDVAKWLTTRWPKVRVPAGVSGEVLVSSRGATIGVTGDANHLEANGIASESGHRLLPASGSERTAPPHGLLWVRANLDPASVASGLLRAASSTCRRCDVHQLESLREVLAAQLTGEVVTYVDRFEPKGPLSTPAGRLSAPRYAVAFTVKNAEAVARALQALRSFPGGHATEAGAAISLPGGEVNFELAGQTLLMHNDSTARGALISSGPAATKPVHALELAIDPNTLARGLGKISLMDVLSSKELAGAFAAATELGPLLANSDSITAWADPVGETIHFSVRWALAAR